jgi:hypothetical protein
MIKARAVIKGQDVIIFGLEKPNLDALMDNKPIMFDGQHVGLHNLKIIIIAGETQADLMEDLRALGVVQ